MTTFQKRSPGEQFPNFKSLGMQENIQVYKGIVERSGAPDISPDQLFQYLSNEAKFLKGLNAKSANFNLLTCLRSQNVQHKDDTYVSWGDITHTDSMKIVDLAVSFKKLWSSGSDDIMIFDNTFDWFLFIDHDGSVFLNKSTSNEHSRPT